LQVNRVQRTAAGAVCIDAIGVDGVQFFLFEQVKHGHASLVIGIAYGQACRPAALALGGAADTEYMNVFNVKVPVRSVCDVSKVDVVLPPTPGANGVNVIDTDGELLPQIGRAHV